MTLAANKLHPNLDQPAAAMVARAAARGNGHVFFGLGAM
jgi:hypothetical protein